MKLSGAYTDIFPEMLNTLLTLPVRTSEVECFFSQMKLFKKGFKIGSVTAKLMQIAIELMSVDFETYSTINMSRIQ